MKKFKDLKLKDIVYVVDNENFIRTRWIEGISIPKLKDGTLRLKLLENSTPIDVSPEGFCVVFGYRSGDEDEDEGAQHLFSSYKEAQKYKETQKEIVILKLNNRALSIFRKLKRMEGLDKTRERLKKLLVIVEDENNK